MIPVITLLAETAIENSRLNAQVTDLQIYAGRLLDRARAAEALLRSVVPSYEVWSAWEKDHPVITMGIPVARVAEAHALLAAAGTGRLPEAP